MTDMNKIDLTGAMWMIIGILGAYGGYKVLSFVYLLIIGATAEVATSGAISVPNVTNGTINKVLASVDTGFVAFINAELVVIGLIALVVIIQVFWPLIAQYLPDKKKKGGMN